MNRIICDVCGDDLTAKPMTVKTTRKDYALCVDCDLELFYVIENRIMELKDDLRGKRSA